MKGYSIAAMKRRRKNKMKNTQHDPFDDLSLGEKRVVVAANIVSFIFLMAYILIAVPSFLQFVGALMYLILVNVVSYVVVRIFSAKWRIFAITAIVSIVGILDYLGIFTDAMVIVFWALCAALLLAMAYWVIKGIVTLFTREETENEKEPKK